MQQLSFYVKEKMTLGIISQPDVLVNSDMFSFHEYDAMLEELGFTYGRILFSRFGIPGKSLDEGLVPLMYDQDVVNSLKYVPRYREIEVYTENGVSSIERHMMEARLGQGRGVAIDEIVEDNVVETAARKEVITNSVKAGKLLFLELNESNQDGNVVEIVSQGSITKPSPLFEGCNLEDENMDMINNHHGFPIES
ncbi:hypothetical protein Tco_1054336 [Tanacetum coccineum]|uniref:Transposase n=1 Tax=Tanacetum coccineum TaxID=301880 RepID=A0ABQ5GXG7_9ASTR